ncbi:hypothetical protein LCGC14_0630600 [marine sediment metagenome]|uniref:Uncharacterized protein n=1 Tax=marine sediment metagenome TaxID=412755 RepID=A0A0F9UAI2_9ZZZZ
MALSTITVRYNTNTTLPSPNAGDLPIVVADIAIDPADGNTYPVGGEPLDFGIAGLNLFREVHACIPTLLEQPTPGVGGTTSLSVLWERDTAPAGINSGHLRFYQAPGVLAPLIELVGGTLYSTLFSDLAFLTVLVVGRPFTDAS